MVMKADLHIHSMYSGDSISKPTSIMSAAADRGIGMIAITDHDSTAAWAEFKDIERRYPVKVIYGQEVKVRQANRIVGELLCLFLQKPVEHETVPEVIRHVNAQGGLVSIAHPFSERRVEFRGYDEIKNWDNIAIEVMNGRSYNRRDNEMAKNLAERLSVPITAGSDAHTPYEVGNCYLEFSGNSAQQLLCAVKNRDVQTGGRASMMWLSLLSTFGHIGLAL